MVGFGKATVTHNQNISQNICDLDECGFDPITQRQSVRIFAIEANASSVISNNHVADNDVGIYLFDSKGLDQVNANILRNNLYFGLVIQDGENTCSQNDIFGGRVVLQL
jgi:parallel beta-helix repeat protein